MLLVNTMKNMYSTRKNAASPRMLKTVCKSVVIESKPSDEEGDSDGRGP